MTSSSSMLNCCNTIKTRLYLSILYDFISGERFLFFFCSLFDRGKNLSRKVVPNGMFFEQKYLPNCPAFRESFRILFLPQEQNKGSVTCEKQKGFQSGGGSSCFLFLQLGRTATAKTEDSKMSNIFVLKTSKIHLKPVPLLGKEMQSILTSN